MTRIRQIISRLRRKLALTPEAADHLATLKFPCC